MRLLNCECGKELVEIEIGVIDDLKELLKPNLKTVGKKSENGRLKICPRCDAYGLGADLSMTFPLYTQDGQITNIQELMKTPDFWQ